LSSIAVESAKLHIALGTRKDAINVQLNYTTKLCLDHLQRVKTAQFAFYCCQKYADGTQNRREICPFCRAPWSKTHADAIEQLKKRVEVNDPRAFYDIGSIYSHGGDEDVVQDKPKAFEYFCRAAELGFADALYAVALAYDQGDGISRDEKKAVHYYEQAAMKGNAASRHNLGVKEYKAGKYNKALKHWLISCGHGDAWSVKNIKRLFTRGSATKEDYEKGLRSYHEYIEEIRSDERNVAAAFDEVFRYYSPLEE
jgi:TPR repeat protein